MAITDGEALLLNVKLGHTAPSATTTRQVQKHDERHIALARRKHLDGEQLGDSDARCLLCNFSLVVRGHFDALSDVEYSTMAKWILENITHDGGLEFFGHQLGFISYANVEGRHDPDAQNRHAQRVEQPFDMQQCRRVIPHFDTLFLTASHRGLHKYLGMCVLYFDILVQGRATSTVFSWHQDTDEDNNPSGADVYRTIIVKLTSGTSPSVKIAGWGTAGYEGPGSFVDFRAAAWHKSHVTHTAGAAGAPSVKIVFFLGRPARAHDGRYTESPKAPKKRKVHR